MTSCVTSVAGLRATRSSLESPHLIAIDSSVLIDLLGDGAYADEAETSVRQALALGPVAICEVVVGEVVSGLAGHGHDGATLLGALQDAGMTYDAVTSAAAVRAGEMQRRYRERRRSAGVPDAGERMLPDFLIGAHALVQCSALITRDAGFFRDYFKGLKVIVPKG